MISERGYPSASPLHRRRGFSYLGLLILIATISIATAAALQVGSVLQRRAAEEELIAIGAELRTALVSYANATPPGQPRAPRSMQDLLKDPRYPNVRRHLRKLYADPLTGKAEWGTIESIEPGGIAGFFSLSEAKPIKIGHFDATNAHFVDAKSYRDWQFVAKELMPKIKPDAPSPLAQF